MIGLDVVVGFLVAWVVRKARRVAGRVDAEIDQALDASLDRLHEVVVGKLGGDPSVEKLQAEVEKSGTASPRTQDRVRLALEDAVEEDSDFAAALEAALSRVQTALGAGGARAGHQGVAISGDVRADHGGVAFGGVTGGSVWLESERRDPSSPGRPQA
jgi:hypothetical protein